MVRKYNKVIWILLFYFLLQFWRVNDLTEMIVSSQDDAEYYLNNYIIYDSNGNDFSGLSIDDKIRLLGNHKFYIRYGWNDFRTAILIFNSKNELIYYDRDIIFGNSYPEDFVRFSIKNSEIRFLGTEYIIPLYPGFLDKIDAKIVQWFAYIINSLGLD